MTIFVPEVYVSEAGALSGRGVFAGRTFDNGETIEFAPVVFFAFPLWKLPEEVRTRLFDWKRLGGSFEAHALGLGYGSLYNHKNPANLNYTANEDRQALQFIAARKIERDEELSGDVLMPRTSRTGLLALAANFSARAGRLNGPLFALGFRRTSTWHVSSTA
jgi:uncharacterized protein